MQMTQHLIELNKFEILLLDLIRSSEEMYRIRWPDMPDEHIWKGILRLSHRHAIAPFIYKSLKSLNANVHVPNSILQSLRAFYLVNKGKNIRLFYELSKVLASLKKNGIPVIVLKGAHLASSIYNDIGHRSMADIDLLFREIDFKYSQSSIKKALLDCKDPHRFDLHWNINLSMTSLSITSDELFERAQSEHIAGIESLVLSAEDLILHLCIHVCFHHNPYQFNGLRTLCDIKEAIRHYYDQIDWDALTHRAVNWGADKAVYLTLRLAKELLNARVPASFFKKIKPDNLKPDITAWAVGQIFLKNVQHIGLSPHFWMLWKPGTFHEKIRNLKELIFPNSFFIFQKYLVPSQSYRNCITYLTRTKRHLPRYAHVTWKIITNDCKMKSLVQRQNQNLEMMEWLGSRGLK